MGIRSDDCNLFNPIVFGPALDRNPPVNPVCWPWLSQCLRRQFPHHFRRSYQWRRWSYLEIIGDGDGCKGQGNRWRCFTSDQAHQGQRAYSQLPKTRHASIVSMVRSETSQTSSGKNNPSVDFRRVPKAPVAFRGEGEEPRKNPRSAKKNREPAVVMVGEK